MYNLQHIKTLAERKKVTLKDIVSSIGMSEAGFHKSIKGGNMGILYLDKIAVYLNVSISELVYDSYYNDNPKPPQGTKQNNIVSDVAISYGAEENPYKLLYELQKEMTDMVQENERLKNGAVVGKAARIG